MDYFSPMRQPIQMLEFVAITAMLLTLNPWMGAHLPVIKVAQQLALLRPLPTGSFNYPRWQATLSIGLFCLMAGMAADRNWADADRPVLSSTPAFILGLATAIGSFSLVVATLQWMVGKHAEGTDRPSFYRVIAAAWLLPAVIGSSLLIAGWSAPLATVVLLALLRISYHAWRSAAPSLQASRAITGLALACTAVVMLLVIARIIALP